jgi:hypothetical protein
VHVHAPYLALPAATLRQDSSKRSLAPFRQEPKRSRKDSRHDEESTPPPAPAPTAAHYTGTGAFQSPSGNINCALFSYGGDDSVQCEVAEHDWVAPPKEPACHLDWGSRFLLNQPAGALFACYGQNLPAPERTLGYGSTWSVGTITCDSESVGLTCTNNSTGHYFFISRQTWRLG